LTHLALRLPCGFEVFRTSSYGLGANVIATLLSSLNSAEFWVATLVTFLLCWAKLLSDKPTYVPAIVAISVGNIAYYFSHHELFDALMLTPIVTVLQIANVWWIAYILKVLFKGTFVRRDPP